MVVRPNKEANLADDQELANSIGTALRAAEVSVQTNNMGQAIADLGTLHGLLGTAFVAVNALRDRAGEAPLDWDAVAGNSAARSGLHTDSGGTPKVAPGGS